MFYSIIFRDVEKEFLSAAEAAHELEVTPRTVAAWIKRGLFPNARASGIKTGRGEIWLIPATDVEDLKAVKDEKKPKRGQPFSENPSAEAIKKRQKRQSFPK